MVSIDHLEVKYGETIALSITNPIQFEKGDRIGIIGSNGAGKSTLVKSIIGLTNYKGKINVAVGADDISVHMQQNEYSNYTNVKTIMETILNTKISNNSKLQELITFFDFEKCLKQKFSTLSGGQKQRLTIIMLLIQDSSLVFFDEVTSGLDFETRHLLMKKVSEWYEGKDNTICMVSHYYEELDPIVNKLLILDQGHVIDFGDKRSLFTKHCGNSVIIFENTKLNEKLSQHFTHIYAPSGFIALTCKDASEEISLIQELIEHNINFKRSNNDIELISINAKMSYLESNKTELEA